MRICWTALCMFTAGFLIAPALVGQTATLSTIRGTAQDPSGAAVAEVNLARQFGNEFQPYRGDKRGG